MTTNKVRLLGHELRDEFKSVSDGSNCYHILTDDKCDDSKLYFITFHTCGPKWRPFSFQEHCALFYRAGCQTGPTVDAITRQGYTSG